MAVPNLIAAQTFSIDWWTADGGGGTSTGGGYSVSGTIGQPDAGGPMTSGPYSVTGGFWVLPTATQTAGAPTLRIMSAGPGQAIISWTPDTPGWALQESPSLSPARWSDSPSGSTNPVRVPTTPPMKFYRLHKVTNVPTLTIAPAEPGKAIISWTPDTPGWVLQESPSLSPAHWTDSPSGSANPTMIPAMQPMKFYRLVKP